MKTFNCVNITHPDFVKLQNRFGYETAALLTRGNNMDIPSISQAEQMLMKERNKNFNNLLDYLNNSNIVDKTGIVKYLKPYVHIINGIVLVNHSNKKGNQSSFSPEILNFNISNLKRIQNELIQQGYNLFKIEPNKTTFGSKIILNVQEINKINSEKSSNIDTQIEVYNEDLEQKSRLFKLTKIQDENSYDKAKNEWKFSPNFDEQQQLNILNTLTGLTFQFVSKALLEGKAVNIFTKEIVNDQVQIVTKKVYQKKLEELNKKGELGLQDTQLKEKLESLLVPKTWNKFQQAVLNNLKQFGFQINKSGEIAQIELKDEDFEQFTPTEEDSDDTNISETEATGKAKNFSDYGEYTISTKEKLSPRLKVWLSSIPSNEESYIAVSFPNLNVENTFVPIDIVINAINEATIGKRTPEAMIEALEKEGNTIKNRYFLLDVAKRLKAEQKTDSRIPNEFFSKFNQTKNEMVMVKTSFTPRKINNQIVRDENNEIVFDINNQVININRGDIPNNLRELWWNDFFFNNSEEENNELTIPKTIYKNIYSNYLNVKDSLFKYFDGYGNLITENSRNEVRLKLSNLFNSINVELDNEVLYKLIDGFNNYNKFKIGESSIFNEKFGILGQIFSEFKPDIANAEKAFGSTGMLKLTQEQAKYVDNFMNTSAKDGKNRSIWAYGLNNPFTREMFEILSSVKELQNQRQEIKEGKNIQENAYILELLKNHYSGKSEILNLLATLPTESLETFLNNFKWSIFNVTKSSVKGAKGKELKHMTPREFINSQIQLFTNSTFTTKIQGVERKWSFKFLTTPSDKTTMFLLNTPDHSIELSSDLTSVKPNTVNLFYDKFLGEYNKIKAYLEGSEEYKKAIDDITTYEPKAFYHFVQFNVKSKFLWNNGKLRDLNEEVDGIKVSTYVKDKIKEQIEQDIAQTKLNWEKEGLIENGKLITGVNQNYREKLPRSVSNIGILETLAKQLETNPLLEEQYLKVLNESDRKITDYLVADFAINKHLFNIEASMLVLGDPTMFLKSSKQKTSQEQFLNSNLNFWKEWGNSVRDNLSKRMAGLQGSGKEPNWQNETANTIVIQDPKTSSKIIDDLKKLNSKIASKFGEIDILDGQEFVTAEEDLHLKFAEGKITKSKYEELLKKVKGAAKELEEGKNISEENQFTPEDVAIAQAQKPLVWALINDSFLKIRKVTYNKPSAFGLYPQFTQGLEIDKLRQSIYDHNKDNKRVDRIVMLSAAKLGAKAPIQNVFNNDGSVSKFTIFANQIDEIPRHYLRIQLEVPYKKSEEIRMLTQSVKLMFNEVLDTIFDENISGKDLKAKHDNLYKQTFQLNYDNFLIDSGAKLTPTGSYEFEDYTKLQETLLQHAITQGYDLNELEGLSLEEDKKSFKLPLAFSAKADKFEKLLLSLINDIILQKIHGRSFVLASEAGFKPSKKTEIVEGKEANDWVNYNKTNIVWSSNFNPEKGLLPQRIDPNNPNKTLPAQVLVSFKFFDSNKKALNLNDFIYEKDGHKFINTKKLSPELLKIIGIRVPTQGHASMADIEIVGFIPDFMGDLIIAPQDFTKQMGSDFDIDKLYSYMYNYQYKNGNLSRFTFDEIKIREARAKKEDKAIDNLILAIFGDSAKESFTESNEKFEKRINEQKIKVLQDQIQDIYHIVLSNKEVYLKMLEGITEGNLTELADQFKKSTPKDDTELPSLSSDRYKIEEYFDNAAGKLGVGVYSANSTFLALIEGKDLFLQKSQKVNYTNKKGEEKTKNVTKPYPFIIKDNKGNSFNLLNLSGAKGVNKLISMFQSASVDNAKLKVLSALSIDKNTMGITAVMTALANDNITENGKPVYSEDYIIKFISQPIIKEYLAGLKTGSDDVKKNPNKSWKSDLLTQIKSKYVQELLDLQGEEAYKTLSIPYNGYSEQDLDFGINQGILNTDLDKEKYLKMQLDILEQFEYFEKVANLLRKTQYLTNTDSKGTPQTIQEALFKKQNQIDLVETAETENSSIVIGNIANVFDNLTDYLFDLGVILPIQIYKGNNFNAPILPYGTFRYEQFIKDFKTLQNKAEQDDFYNAQEFANLYNSFLSFIWSFPSLNIADTNLSQERLSLIKDTETNKSLATEIEEFKQTIDYFNSPILKPLFNSLKSKPNKKDPSLKFIDFQVSVGLINPDTEVILSLEYLRNLNYPLFEKIIKYSLLVTPANSTTSLRKFIPNFYLEAIGISKELNKINKLLNTETAYTNLAKKDSMPPVSPLIYQTLQHYPNYAQNIDNNFKGFNEDKSKLQIDLKINSDYILIYDRIANPYQFISSYDSNLKKWRLYEFQSEEKTEESVFANYQEIPILGDYNLSEFDASYTSNTPKPSIIKSNNPVGIEYTQPTIIEQIDETSQIYSQLGNKTQSENVVVKSWGELKNATKAITSEGIIATRIPNTDEHFGNPFSHDPAGKTQGLIKTETVEEAVKKYIDWVINGANFKKKNLFGVTPIQSVDKKAIVKASIATQYIGFGEGINNSSTELYRQQAGKFANTGNYSEKDTIFVSVGGKRGTEQQQKEQQDRTIKEALKAIEAGAILITDNKSYVDSNSYNTGEKRLAQNLQNKGYNYVEKTIDGQILGVWYKGELNPLRSEWVREQLELGKLKGKPILYYKELGEPSHATALDYLINKYDWNEKQIDVKQDVKEGVDFVFNENPELANIGTKEQYSQYLDTIFPDSKVKDIVYHGSEFEFDKFQKRKSKKAEQNEIWEERTNIGFFFTKDINEAKAYAPAIIGYDENGDSIYSENEDDYGFIYSVLINIKNPIVDIEDQFNLAQFERANKKRSQNTDSIIITDNYRFNYAVFDQEQIHILGSKQDIEEFKKFVAQQTEEINSQIINNPIGFNTGYLETVYKYSDNKSGKENVSNILDSIQKNSSNKAYKIIAQILLEVSKKQNLLDGVNLNLSNKNEYDSKTQTIYLDLSDNDSFPKTFEYNFLHELVHHITIGKMTDGSEISKILTRNIQNLINVLETEENLQKAIDLLGLKTTPQELQNKLNQLRQEQSTSQEESLTTFNSEKERSILNPLINPFEFVSSILNDENTQKWMNEINYPQSELSIFGKFTDYIKGLFNNLIRTLGFKPNKTVLNEGLNTVLQILTKEDAKKQGNQLDLFGTFKLTKVEKEAQTEVKKIAIQRLEDRRNLLWNEFNKVKLDKKLSKEDSKLKQESLLKRINTINRSIEKLKNEFNAALLEEEGFKAIDFVKSVLAKSDPSISEIMESIAILHTQKELARKVEFEAKNVTPELKQVITNLYGASEGYLQKILSISADSVVAKYNDITGRNISKEEFLEITKNAGFKNAFLGGEDVHNPLTQFVATLVYEMGIKTQNEINEAQLYDEKELNRYTEKYDFKNLLEIREEYDPITNVTKKIKNFKTRTTAKYYQTLRDIFANASEISGKNKPAYIQARLNETKFILDLRYLFVEEFNKDMGTKTLSLEDKNKYLEKLKEFFIKEYSEYPEDYAIFRMNELIQQAEKRFESYIDLRNQQFELIQEEFPENLAQQTVSENNWLAYNSPFLLLNERYSLSPDNMSLKIQIPHSKLSAKVTENGETKFVPWTKIDEVTGESVKIRMADKYLTDKPRRKDFNGQFTGFINDEYTNWELEFFQKALPAIEKGEIPPVTMLGFLKLIQQMQHEYLKYLPNYLTKDVGYYTMLDVPADFKEMMQEAQIFQKFVLAGELVWDDVVKTTSIPFIEEQSKKIDLITEQIQKEFNPRFQNDSFNQRGLGELKTNDVFKYFDFIRKATITYKNKLEAENSLKIAQFLYSQGALKNSKNEVYNKDKELFDWIINNKLYNEQKDTRIQRKENIFNPVSKKKWKLTKAEKEKIKIFEQQLSDILEKYPDIENATEEIQKEYYKIQSQIDKIQRQRTSGTTYDIFDAFLRLKFMGWSSLGRIFDTIGTAFIGNIYEALDGRIFNQPSLLKSLGIVNASYGAGYVGSLASTSAITTAGVATAGTVTGLLPAAALTGTIGTFAVAGATGLVTQKVIDQTELKQKVSQILFRTGALEHFDYLSKEDERDILNGILSELKPYSLLEKADIYNKATTVIAATIHYKIKDKNGKNRSLWDAFIVNNGELTWNDEEFNPQDSYNLEFTGDNSKEWVNFRKKIERALKNVHGDMASGFTAPLSRKETSKRILLFLKTYMTQVINKYFSGQTYDSLTNTYYTGRIAGSFNVISNFIKKENQTQEDIAAAKQMLFNLSVWASLAIAAKLIESSIKKSMGGDDDDDFLWILLNFINRTSADVASVLDIDSNRIKQTSTIFPQLRWLFDFLSFNKAIIKSFNEGDTMTRAEMSANKLIPRNQIIDQETREEYNKETESYEDVTYYKIYDPTTDEESNWLKNPPKYNKEFEPTSRVFYKGMKISPFTNSYKQLENLRKTNNLYK